MERFKGDGPLTWLTRSFLGKQDHQLQNRTKLKLIWLFLEVLS